MKNTRRALAALTILLLAGSARAGTQGRVSGKITDSAGNGIEGVTITVTTPAIKSFKITLNTKKDGSYGFIVNDATMLYDLKFEKEGFAPGVMTKQKFSTVEVKIVNQTLLKASEAPAGRGAGGRPAAPSANEQAAEAYNAAVDLLNAGNKDGAEAKLLEAVGKSPDLPQAWQALAVIAHEKKNWAKALEYGQKALDLDPNLTSLYGILTDSAEKAGDKKAAAEWRKRYDEANPDTPEILYNKGVEFYNKGKMKDAEGPLLKAVEKKPEFAMAHFLLGMASFNLNKKAQAREHLQKYLELDPNGKEAGTAKEILPLLK